MFLWIFKQLLTLKNAVAGRNHPRQMAWGVAFGVLLGVIPHGNLLTIGLVLLVLCLNLNHAVAALTGLGCTLFATQLDGYSHPLGQFVLLHPSLTDALARFWQLPMVPWTDLNNTIVMGSFLIGLTLLLPSYVLSYPIFQWLAPAAKQETDAPDPEPQAARAALAPEGLSYRPDAASSSGPAQPHLPEAPKHRPAVTEAVAQVDGGTIRIDEAESTEAQAEAIGIETQIDVIRLKDYRKEDAADSTSGIGDADQAQINEALNFLLRRLRHSQQEKAA